MIELLQITNDPEFARRCDALEGLRLFVDLERLGKAERQAGRNTFISAHQLDDVGRIKAVLTRSRLMVRVNPLNPATKTEVDAVLAQGADLLMLPMFTSADELRAFSGLVAGRAPIVPLLETAAALQTLDDWIATPGLAEVFVGLNDLHLSLGCRFMFEPLADGLVERVARAARAQGLRFGFGGIARLDEGLLPGRDVLGEHLRLGSQAVILSRTFHRSDAAAPFEQEVAVLRAAERELAERSAAQIEADRARVNATIEGIAARMEADA
ncbi:aldolase/citrate lyase family protein [Variovorax terrae]|uniref:HpcH/HpaI aldolase/citrate lyase family protein n=1 Tax=Variovorax terrae TaxID=2923278 RepID=A0A9X2ANE4_9BURK|nr:aldolase/citrate lyase family protein [Variovorax terrae]MCJ0764284.1 HpcH/HpaI aldolase/citrate lyase family protein [Variovorax terrae]